MPSVSVIIPSFNHENYIEECMNSVFAQTFQDFEIIITDDASSDRTVEIIERFKDPRIKLFKHNTNKGASIATNNCIHHASGKYIAMLSSDDAWYPNKLQVQVEYLEAHPEIGVVFGKVDWIDEEGAVIKSTHFPFMDVFNENNRSRFEWLNHFFYKGNCLCHPCSLVRRECYNQVGLLNPSFASVPDFDLWIRVCMKYEIYILDQRLIRFRRMSKEGNASGDTDENRVRNRYELRHTLDHYLQITNIRELNAIFPRSFISDDLDRPAVHFLIAQSAIKSGVDYKALWGLDLIYSILQNDKHAQVLKEKFNFTYMDYITLVGRQDIFRVSSISSSLVFHPPVNQPGLLGNITFLTKAYLRGLYKALIKLITHK